MIKGGTSYVFNAEGGVLIAEHYGGHRVPTIEELYRLYQPDWAHQTHQTYQSSQPVQPRQVYEPYHPTAGLVHHPRGASEQSAQRDPGLLAAPWRNRQITQRLPSKHVVNMASHTAKSTQHEGQQSTVGSQRRFQSQALHDTTLSTEQVDLPGQRLEPDWSALQPVPSTNHTTLHPSATLQAPRFTQTNMADTIATRIGDWPQLPPAATQAAVNSNTPAERVRSTPRSGLTQFALMISSAGLLSAERLQAAIDETPEEEEDSDVEQERPSTWLEAEIPTFPNINPLPERRVDTPFSRLMRVVETMPQLGGQINPLYDFKAPRLPDGMTQTTAYFVDPTSSQADDGISYEDPHTEPHGHVQPHQFQSYADGSV